MSETAEEKERRVVAQFRNYLPTEIDRFDGEILLSILYKIGVMTKYLDDCVYEEDTEDEFSNYFDFKYELEMDSEGRITFLDISQTAPTYDVPPIIERLQKLERIKFKNCKLIPIELGNLSLLKSITFINCDRAFESISEGLVLSAFKQVEILGFRGSSLSAFWKSLRETLEELTVRGLKREQSEEILSGLQNRDFGFRESLKKIKLEQCKLNEGDLERLLFDILPRFANIHTRDLDNNKIESFLGIED